MRYRRMTVEEFVDRYCGGHVSLVQRKAIEAFLDTERNETLLDTARGEGKTFVHDAMLKYIIDLEREVYGD